MKILFDDQIFKLQKFGGISRYFTELIYELNRSSLHQAIFPFLNSKNIHYNERFPQQSTFLDRVKMFVKLKFSEEKKDRYFARENKKKIVNALKGGKFDLFVPTYYDTYFLPLLGDKPFVLNVYDMIHEIFPSHFLPEDFSAKHKEELLKKATKIIAISESTKRDILKFYPNTDASKIHVVYLSHSLVNQKLIALDLPEKYVLFVGNRSNYKNFIFFFESIAQLLKNDEQLHIVCAGGNAFTAEEQQLINSYGLSAKVIQRNFKDFELATYYIKAECFIFPSAYEGFGIPVLEAMSCGCPIILANHSSFPEVAGEAGLYFELENKEDLKEKVNSILTDGELRKAYSAKGLAQAKKFSWKKTTDECIEIFKTVAS